MEFKAYRRLVEDGDFNADIPIDQLMDGENTITLEARTGEGAVIRESLKVNRETGDCQLPFQIRWQEVANPQDVGQYVDGKWRLTEKGLRTAQVGYDRIFLIGNRDWQDYEVRTTLTLHAVPGEDIAPLHGGNGAGILWRFAGHVVGGHRDFPQAQPKWGYQPFGAIGWLRWPRDHSGPPYLQFYPGSSDYSTDYGRFSAELETVYALRLRCATLPDATSGDGVTRYSFKIWLAGEPEPDDWTWQHLQTDPHALRRGGPALLAHHVDLTFGDVTVVPVNP